MGITTTLLFLLAMQGAAQSPDAARAAYGKCLRTFTVESLKADKETATFETEVAAACPKEAETFRAAVIRVDRADGLSAAEAKADADEQTADMLDNFKSKYADYKETNTMPGNG